MLDDLKTTLGLSADALRQTDELLGAQGDLDTMGTDLAALGTSGALSILWAKTASTPENSRLHAFSRRLRPRSFIR
ncbi:MAG: hypothetical protein ACLTQI_05990 [Slackia sp.]